MMQVICVASNSPSLISSSADQSAVVIYQSDGAAPSTQAIRGFNRPGANYREVGLKS